MAAPNPGTHSPGTYEDAREGSAVNYRYPLAWLTPLPPGVRLTSTARTSRRHGFGRLAEEPLRQHRGRVVRTKSSEMGHDPGRNILEPTQRQPTFEDGRFSGVLALPQSRSRRFDCLGTKFNSGMRHDR